MIDHCSRLFRGGVTRCREWAFFLAGALVCELILLGLWIFATDQDFVRYSRNVGLFGIAITVVYKTTVIAVMTITKPKTPLDRRLIWHLAAMDALMLYLFLISIWPQWFGFPPNPRAQPDFDPSAALIRSTVLFYNIIGFVMWSAIAVLNALYHERFRYVRYGVFRMLKVRTGGLTSETE